MRNQNQIENAFNKLRELQDASAEKAFAEIFKAPESANTAHLLKRYKAKESQFFDATFFITSFFGTLDMSNQNKVIEYFASLKSSQIISI